MSSPYEYPRLTLWSGKAKIRLELRSTRKETIMRTLSLSEAKMKLSELVQSVHETEQEVVITKNGSPAAVLISLEEFESWRETLLIAADAGLMDEIRTGLAGLQKGNKLYTLEELFDRP